MQQKKLILTSTEVWIKFVFIRETLLAECQIQQTPLVFILCTVSVSPLVSLQNIMQQQVTYIHIHYLKLETGVCKLRINRLLSFGGVDTDIVLLYIVYIDIVIVIALGVNGILKLLSVIFFKSKDWMSLPPPHFFSF